MQDIISIIDESIELELNAAAQIVLILAVPATRIGQLALDKDKETQKEI